MAEELSLTFLGSGTSMGVPVIGCQCPVCQSSDVKDNRLRSSVLFQIGEINIVIDSGPDFRYQMLRSGISSLDGLVFTHEHKDHTAGMDDVRAFNFIQQKKVSVYADKRVEEVLRRDFHYAFAEIKYPGVPEIEIVRIENEPFEVAGTRLIPIQVMHHKLPVYGFRIGDISYVTDANYIAPKELKKLTGSKVLVLNALRKQKHISHFTLEQALEVIDMVKPERAYLTHISHQMGKHADISAELPPNVYLAYDGLKVSA